jgi:hypothetical protein
LVPDNNFYEIYGSHNPKLLSITNSIDVINTYYLKKHENLDLNLKEAILRFKF